VLRLRPVERGGQKCARVAREKEAREAARAQAKPDAANPEIRNVDWIGVTQSVTETADAIPVTVQFENVYIGEHATVWCCFRVLVLMHRLSRTFCAGGASQRQPMPHTRNTHEAGPGL
jgi:hypothetical protein